MSDRCIYSSIGNCDGSLFPTNVQDNVICDYHRRHFSSASWGYVEKLEAEIELLRENFGTQRELYETAVKHIEELEKELESAVECPRCHLEFGPFSHLGIVGTINRPKMCRIPIGEYASEPAEPFIEKIRRLFPTREERLRDLLGKAAIALSTHTYPPDLLREISSLLDKEK